MEPSRLERRDQRGASGPVAVGQGTQAAITEVRVDYDRLETPRRGPSFWIGIALLLLAVAAVAVPSLRWRVEVVGLQLTGHIPDMRLGELLRLITPGAGQPNISRLLATRNPYAVVRVPSSEPDYIAAGAKTFQTECSACHGADAGGGPGAPALVGREFKHGESEWSLYRTVRYGIEKTAMMPHPLEWGRIWQVVAYIRSLDVAAGVDAVDPKIQTRLDGIKLPYAELAAAAEPGADWPNFSGSYASVRHSSLTQINAQNVGNLALRWVVQLDSEADKIESSPVVRDGVLFVTVPPARVMALDGVDGHRIWVHEHPYERIGGGEGPIGQNRGVALLDDKVYVGTWDAKLTALSASTGKVVWETVVDRNYPASYISAAPLALDGLIVTGVGTAPRDSRGFISAFDAKTGAQRWRVESIPEPGQPGHDTWKGDSWKVGGAGTWMTGTYDVQTDTLYWGVGGAKPDFDSSSRSGDNLYSDSILALRGATGELLWHFQFTPGDTHDWDSNQVPMLVTADGPRGPEKHVLWANRNGFYYVLNAKTGAFIRGVPFVEQNWAERLDSHGRPILRDAPTGSSGARAGGGGDVDTSARGRPVFPGAKGGTNWWPPTYDPVLNRVYIPFLEQGMVFFPTAQTLPTTAGRSFYTGIRALDASTGERIWEHRQATRRVGNDTGGLLSTRGGVVFGSDQTRFFALDSRTGQQLWSVETGGTIMSAPVTYALKGEQMVTIAAGRSLLTFALPPEH
ncbi:MAG TPA: PQQ-binding-like beta-propeller repeat protein [Steroidobacteraceae bacterium]|jgi:alcohol dehydrogenase (cytochrome c)